MMAVSAQSCSDEDQLLTVRSADLSGLEEHLQKGVRWAWRALLAIALATVAVAAAFETDPFALGKRNSRVQVSGVSEKTVEPLKSHGLAMTWRIDDHAPYFLTPGARIFDFQAGDFSKQSFKTSKVSEVKGESSKEFGQDFSSKVGVDASYMAFSGSAELSFQSTDSRRVKKFCMMRSNIFTDFKLSSNVPFPHKRLTAEWKKFLLEATAEAIHERLGDFFAVELMYGGAMKTTTTTEMIAGESASSIEGKLRASYDNILSASLSASAGKTSTYASSEHSFKSSTSTYGGDAKIWAGLSHDNFDEIHDLWAKSIKDINEIEVGFTLRPIWELLDHDDMDKGKADKLKTIMVDAWKFAANGIPEYRPVSKTQIKPVFDFWHAGNSEHTFHFDNPWGGESKGEIQFWAFSSQVQGTHAVYDFWHHDHSEHTFHFLPAWGGERKNNAQFWAFAQEMPGTVPIYDFWHKGHSEHTFHEMGPWSGESRGNTQFWAFHDKPGFDKWLGSRGQEEKREGEPIWIPAAAGETAHG